MRRRLDRQTHAGPPHHRILHAFAAIVIARALGALLPASALAEPPADSKRREKFLQVAIR